MRSRSRAMFIGCLGILFASSPAPLSAGPRPWGIGFDALFAGEFREESSGGFPSTLVPQVAVQRPVSRTLWWKSELGYHDARYNSRQTRMVPIALGFRWADVASSGFGAYLELAPALFAYWIDGEYSGPGADDVVPGESARNGVVPALVTGFGLHFRANKSISMSYGVRIHRTAKVDEEFGTLNQVGFQIGVDWRPLYEE